MNQVVGVIGVGVMGKTILDGVIKSGCSPDQVLVADRSEQLAARVAQETSTQLTQDLQALVKACDVVIVAVKPQDMGALLATISSSIRPETILASVAVGLKTAFYEERLPQGIPVVRIMPNTPALIGEGMSVISPGKNASEDTLVTVEKLLAPTGTVLRIPEKNQDAAGAISGSGPAYVFYVIDALAEAGVLLGLPRDQALTLAEQTVQGAARLAVESEDSPTTLRERVSSPGGTTIAGLRELDARSVRAAFIAAAEAARNRSAVLGEELSRG